MRECPDSTRADLNFDHTPTVTTPPHPYVRLSRAGGTFLLFCLMARAAMAQTPVFRWAGDANGMAVMIGHRIAGVELFGDAGTFRALREKLLRSYAVDALESERGERPVLSDRRTIELFLRRAEDARLSAKETIGLGRLFGVDGRDIYGSALTWHEQRGAHGVVHASVFSDEREVEIQPRSHDLRPRPLPRE